MGDAGYLIVSVGVFHQGPGRRNRIKIIDTPSHRQLSRIIRTGHQTVCVYPAGRQSTVGTHHIGSFERRLRGGEGSGHRRLLSQYTGEVGTDTHGSPCGKRRRRFGAGHHLRHTQGGPGKADRHRPALFRHVLVYRSRGTSRQHSSYQQPQQIFTSPIPSHIILNFQFSIVNGRGIAPRPPFFKVYYYSTTGTSSSPPAAQSATCTSAIVTPCGDIRIV